MEELVGRWWHQAMVRLTRPQHVASAVSFEDVKSSFAVMFRAAGGPSTIRPGIAGERRLGGPRSALQRLAGAGERAAMTVLDSEVLAVAPSLAVFPDAALNRDLYLWLAMLAAHFRPDLGWLPDNFKATQAALDRFPGFERRYRRLCDAQLALRPQLAGLRGRHAEAEAAVQSALRGESCASLALCATDVFPVWLWVIAGAAKAGLGSATGSGSAEASDGAAQASAANPRRSAEKAAEDGERPALVLPFRAEALMSWSERVRVDRSEDDDDDGSSQKAADDMDVLSLARNGKSLAGRVRFDLDLPSSSADDLPVGPGLLLPEWDYRRNLLVPGQCSVQALRSRTQKATGLSPGLQQVSARLRRRFESLRDASRFERGQLNGEDIDFDAFVRLQVEDLSAMTLRSDSPAVYRQRVRGERSLATLLLADLSQSTDAHAHDDARVIDVIRDALMVFCEALATSGDPLAVWGFSSVRRQHVRMHAIKGFDERWQDPVRARVAAIRPGYYTRMGAALRHASLQLSVRPEKRRLLLLLTDGKPNDLDHYEGRYGLEDTRHAIHEARQAGLTPFAITIDAQAQDYLPMLFGARGFAQVRKPQDLVHRLAMVWSTLAR